MKASGFFGNWAKYSMEKRMKNDEIFDESGFQVGTAAPLSEKISNKDYFTCRGNSVYELEQQVNKMVKVGYKPCGGLSIYEGKFYQAVFLDLPTDKQEAPTYDKNYLHF